MTPYKNLFIDLDDTLWAFTENARDAFREVYSLYRFDNYFDSFESFFDIYTERNRVLWLDYNDGKINKETLNYERFSYPLLQAGVINAGLVRSYMSDYFDIVPTKQKLMPYAREVLAYLHGKYNLYILSNGFRELQYRKIRSAGIEAYFNGIILSDDIGVNKPHAEIYRHALSVAQSTLDEALMIGDNFDVDIAGAARIGMDQVFYNHCGKLLKSFRPTYEITSLRELRELL